MQAWWAEDNSLKTLKILLFKNIWLVVYVMVYLFFDGILLCSPTQHLFDKKYSNIINHQHFTY